MRRFGDVNGHGLCTVSLSILRDAVAVPLTLLEL